MSAKPKPPSSDSDVDAVLEKIDACLPVIERRAEAVRRGDSHTGDTPPSGFHPRNIKKTQMAFQAMSDDSLLTGSGEDIKVPDPEETTDIELPAKLPEKPAAPLLPTPSIASAAAKPKSQKRTLFFFRRPDSR